MPTPGKLPHGASIILPTGMRKVAVNKKQINNKSFFKIIRAKTTFESVATCRQACQQPKRPRGAPARVEGESLSPPSVHLEILQYILNKSFIFIIYLAQT